MLLQYSVLPSNIHSTHRRKNHLVIARHGHPLPELVGVDGLALVVAHSCHVAAAVVPVLPVNTISTKSVLSDENMYLQL